MKIFRRSKLFGDVEETARWQVAAGATRERGRENRAVHPQHQAPGHIRARTTHNFNLTCAYNISISITNIMAG